MAEMTTFKRWLISRNEVTPADSRWIKGLGCEYEFKQHVAEFMAAGGHSFKYATKSEFSIMTTTQKQEDMLALKYCGDMHLMESITIKTKSDQQIVQLTKWL